MTSQPGQNPLRHPVQLVTETMNGTSSDPGAAQKSTFFQGLNEGPAEHAAKLTGLVTNGKREDVRINNVAVSFKLTRLGCSLFYEQ